MSEHQPGEKINGPDKAINQAADYYVEPFYDNGAVYGFTTEPQQHSLKVGRAARHRLS